MEPTVERVTAIPHLNLGEGPHWDVDAQTLYFVDVYRKTINRYVPSSGQYSSAQLETRLSIIIPVKGKKNQFITASGNDVNIITWDGISDKVSKIETLASPDDGTQGNHLNDGKCDSNGKLWIGSVGRIDDLSKFEPNKTGALYSVDNTGKVSTHLTEISCSNGMAWNTELKQFYYTDSKTGTVDVFDFDIEKGTISNRRPIFTVSKHSEGIPDGMTIDADGNLWVAVFGGYNILKVDPRKPETLLQRVQIPAKQITSAAWGGKDLDELYVTTANIDYEKDASLPDNGAVFKITGLGTKGLPMGHFVLQ